MSTKQLDGCSHLELPEKGSAPSCSSLGYTGQLQRTADTLQLLPKTTDRSPQTEGSLAPHPDPWDEVSSLVVVGAGGCSLHRRPHPVFVVLADEDAGQLPQRSHVEGLKQLALMGSEPGWKPTAKANPVFLIMR